jgi:long-subunit fatty acid transport protein
MIKIENLTFSNKALSLLLVFFLACSFCPAQDKENENPYKGLPFKERLFIGGGLGLSFGTITNIRIAPVVGYRISPDFSVGAGPSYQYYSDKRFNPKLESTIYGGSVFGRYFVLEQIFLHSEFEVLNLDRLNFDPTTNDFFQDRVTIPLWFVGGGFSSRNANGSGFFISVLYDLIQDRNSPYTNNLAIRVGGFISL